MAMKEIFNKIRYSFWTFIVFYFIFCLTHGIQGSYTSSALTSLEKKFRLPSSLSGVLVTIASIGYFIGAPLVPHYFGKKHRVRLFAVCMLSTGLCGLLYTIPHFVYGPSDEVFSPDINSPDSVKTLPEESNLCLKLNRNSTQCENHELISDTDNSPNYVALTLFCFSEIFHGIAGASIWTVGIAFIDDNLPLEFSSKLIGVMFLMRYISPVLSYGFSGFFLSLHHTLKPTSLLPEHPKWLGAWWLGYMICFIINTAVSIPTFFLPEEFKMDDSNEAAAKESNNQNANIVGNELPYDISLKELYRKSVRIIKNPVFTISSVAVSIDCYLYAFYAFVPKYVEVHFVQTAWIANILGGMIPCVAGGLMCYFGGVVSGKFKRGVDQGVSKNVLFSWFLSAVDALLILLIIFIPCSQSYLPFSYDRDSSKVQFNHSCNMDCECVDSMFDPICGSDDSWHMSPCHAGCTSSHVTNGSTVFSNCSCISNEAEAVMGMCTQPCVFYLAAYVALLTLLTAVNSSYSVPVTNVVLKCVHESDKSLALGLQTVFICISMFPSTIIFGQLLDWTCILWSSIPCSKSTGFCLAYDHQRFRLVLHGLTLACKFCSAILYGFNYMIALSKVKCMAMKETQMKDVSPENPLTNKVET